MSEAALLTEAKEIFRDIATREDHNRQQYVNSTKFYNSDQWPEYLLRARQNNPDGARPCLTINVLPHYVKQVTNEMRMNRPSIRVLPVDSGADVETAKVFQGVIRHIEQCSDADVVYATAGKTQVVGGVGYWRILSEYIDQAYGYQELRLKRILNPMTVYFGPCECPAGSDVKDVFITTLLPRKQFQKEHPDLPAENWNTDGMGDTDWYIDDAMRLAEWFRIEEVKRKAITLQDGSKILESDIKEAIEQGATIEYNADTFITDRQIKWMKMTGHQVLEKRDLPGRYIPVVRVIGQECEVEGKIYHYGLVRDAVDAQRMRNYWRSCETEMIALAPKAPYIGPVGAFDGFEADWAAANVSNKPYLEYNSKGADGEEITMPQRQPAAPLPTAIVQAAMNADEDIKSATGLFGASLGEPSNEKSGKAILARQKEGDISTYDFLDNLNISIRHTGRILVDLIPKYYDTERVVRILGEDETPQMVMLNPGMQNSRAESEMEGVEGIYNLGVGTYDVVTATGPNFSTKRQEAAESMAQLLQGNPDLWRAAGDLFAKNLDWPGADVLAERLKKLVPPELTDEDEQPAENPQQTAMIQQMDQAIQAMTAEMEQLQQAADQQETERLKLQLEREKLQNEKTKLALDEYRAETERMTMIAQNPHIIEILKPLGLMPELTEEPMEERAEQGAVEQFA